MKQRHLLIVSIFSITMSILALTVSIYAWFVNTAEGYSSMSGQVIDNYDIIDFDSSKAYYLDYNDDKYTIGTEIDFGSINIKKYDSMNDASRAEELLLKIKVNTENFSSVTMKAITSNQIYSHSLKTTADQSNTLNMSNVVGFYNVTISDNEVSFNEEDIVSFVTLGEVTDSKIATVSINNEPIDGYLYVLVDFNDVLLQEIYTKNLGLSILNNSLVFKNDFNFVVEVF